MVRTLPAAPKPVLDKMRYIPARIIDWKNRFSIGETTKPPKAVKPAKPAQKPKRKAKAPAKRITVKKAEVKKPAPVTAVKPAAKALVFIKKEPVTFCLRRQEHPGDFERMVFVTKACAVNPQDKHLMVLHVEQVREGSWLVASDGKRLHAALIPTKIASGDYKPVVTKDTVSLGEPVTGIMFPSWRRVIPGDTVRRGTIDLVESGWGKDRKETEKLSVAFNAFVRQTGKVINLRYLEDLAKRRWSVHCQREKNRAVMLKAEGVQRDMFAVIMPLADEDAAQAA